MVGVGAPVVHGPSGRHGPDEDVSLTPGYGTINA